MSLMRRSAITVMIEELYKSHHILVSLIPNFDPDTWTPRVFIWLPVEFFKQNQIRKSYSTKAAAVDRALEAARQWIDEGKPELFPEKCDSDTIIQMT